MTRENHRARNESCLGPGAALTDPCFSSSSPSLVANRSFSRAVLIWKRQGMHAPALLILCVRVCDNLIWEHASCAFKVRRDTTHAMWSRAQIIRAARDETTRHRISPLAQMRIGGYLGVTRTGALSCRPLASLPCQTLAFLPRHGNDRSYVCRGNSLLFPLMCAQWLDENDQKQIPTEQMLS